jgi:catechol 2,3-dioxygenase-like lactoylglutathione lyase family enzyme
MDRIHAALAITGMEHVGIVVDDLAAAIEFFVGLGLEVSGEGSAEGRWVDRIVGLDGVRAEIVFVQTPDGHAQFELTRFHAPRSRATVSSNRRTRPASAISRSPSTISTPQ